MPPLTTEEITKRGYIEGTAGERYTLGSKEATDYLQKSYVSMLSTDNATNTVNRGMDRLNQMSPTTAPGYQAPPPTTDKPIIPKAYFANESGQEAEYTEAQLRDPATREFLTQNGYVMTKTEGPSLAAGEVSGIDKKLESLIDTITNYNVDEDPGFKMQADSIRQQFGQLKAEMEVANKQRAGTLATMGIRGGTSRYAGGVQLGIEGEELKQAGQRLADIARKEADAISAARSAYRTGKFSQFNTQVNSLEKLRNNKVKELETINKTMAEARKKVEETVYRSSRDSAIAGLLAQGITDAAQILDYLNFDESGKLVGDFTAKEVADTLKNIAPGNDLKNLTGTVKEFYSLLGSGALPASITELPEDEQFFAYLSMKKKHTTAPKAPGNGKNPPGTNLITLSEARASGLPVSVVGSSEQDIINDLQKPKPPTWFVEKLIAEQGNDNYAETIWNEYRLKVNQSSTKKETKGPVKLYSSSPSQ